MLPTASEAKRDADAVRGVRAKREQVRAHARIVRAIGEGQQGVVISASFPETLKGLEAAGYKHEEVRAGTYTISWHHAKAAEEDAAEPEKPVESLPPPTREEMQDPSEREQVEEAKEEEAKEDS